MPLCGAVWCGVMLCGSVWCGGVMLSVSMTCDTAHVALLCAMVRRGVFACSVGWCKNGMVCGM